MSLALLSVSFALSESELISSFFLRAIYITLNQAYRGTSYHPSRYGVFFPRGCLLREDQRPQIGQLVARQSDYVVFTSDNPRHEDANKILEEITKGTRKTNYEVIENRKEAIKTAISKLTEKDILLILGKGNEEYQEIDGDKFPFKDENEVLKYVKN